MQVKSKTFLSSKTTPPRTPIREPAPYPDTGACPVPRYGGEHDPLRPPRARRRSTLMNGADVAEMAEAWQKRGRNDRNGLQSWTAPLSALERGQLWQKWQKWQVKSKNYLRSSAPKATSPRTRMTGPAQSSMDNRTLTNDISLQKPRIRTPFPQHMKPCS